MILASVQAHIVFKLFITCLLSSCNTDSVVSHRLAYRTVLQDFMGLANVVITGTNHLLHTEEQLAKQVLAKEHELGALRQRSAILTAERVKFNQSTADLKGAYESKVCTQCTWMATCHALSSVFLSST